MEGRTPWTLEEFRQVRPGVPDDVLSPLLKICNSALANGLTREQVADTLTRLGEEYPDTLEVTTILDAFMAEIDALPSA